MTRALRELAYLAFATGLLVAVAIPPDFDRVTLAYLSDFEQSVDNAFAADFFTGPSPALCSVFWALRSSGADTLLVEGNSHIFDACLYSNSGANLSGNTNTFNKTIRYVGPYANASATNIFLAPVLQVAPQPYPFAFNISDYAPGGCKANAALAQGKYFTRTGNNVQIGGNRPIDSGLWYITGSAVVSTGSFTGNITIVATGGVRLDAGTGGARPYVDDLLVLANGTVDDTVRVQGNGPIFGAIHVPNGEMVWQGAGNNYTGQVSASTLTLGGHSSTFRPSAPTNAAPCGPGAAIAGAALSAASEPALGASPDASPDPAAGPLALAGEVARLVGVEHDWSREEF